MAIVAPAQAEHRRRRRPFALIVLAGLMLLKAVLILLLAAGVALADSQIGALLRLPDIFETRPDTLLVAVILGMIGAVLFASALGILAYRRAGWLLAMVTTGIAIGFDIVGYANGTSNHLWAVLNIITVFYLNQRAVRESVGATTPTALGHTQASAR